MQGFCVKSPELSDSEEKTTEFQAGNRVKRTVQTASSLNEHQLWATWKVPSIMGGICSSSDDEAFTEEDLELLKVRSRRQRTC